MSISLGHRRGIAMTEPAGRSGATGCCVRSAASSSASSWSATRMLDRCCFRCSGRWSAALSARCGCSRHRRAAAAAAALRGAADPGGAVRRARAAQGVCALLACARPSDPGRHPADRSRMALSILTLERLYHAGQAAADEDRLVQRGDGLAGGLARLRPSSWAKSTAAWQWAAGWSLAASAAGSASLIGSAR